MTRRLTGRHVLAIAVGAFGLVIAANLAMLFAATGTFPGLVVENSYVASQQWNERVAARQALGWTGTIAHDGTWFEVRLTDAEGVPVAGPALAVTVGRPTTEAEDIRFELAAADGVYRSRLPLAGGLWRVEVATRSGPEFRLRTTLSVGLD